MCAVAVPYSKGVLVKEVITSCYPKKLGKCGDQVLSTRSLSVSKRCEGSVFLFYLVVMQTQPSQLSCTTLGKAGPILFGCSVI